MPSETIFVFLKVFICVIFPHFLLEIPVNLKSIIDMYFIFTDLCRKKERKNKKEIKRKEKKENICVVFVYISRKVN